MNGIVILNKESGISSNTACRKVGKILGEKKVGHLGTLDVLAKGVLPVALGKYTKLFDFFLQKRKTYIAEFTFGYESTTLDNEGEIINTSNILPSKKEIENILPEFIGKQNQMPPKYSAKKINGQCAYNLARNNQEFELKTKEIEIYEFVLLNQKNDVTFEFKITCSSGTYIRAIARDLAYKFNTYATMTNLLRVKCANFDIENAYTLEEIESEKEKAILSDDKVFFNFEKIKVNQDQMKKLLNGQTLIILEDNRQIDNVLVMQENEIIGIGALIDKHLKLTIHLKEHV